MGATGQQGGPLDQQAAATRGRVERTLDAALAHGETAGCPPRLSTALRYAVFPGGARIRPRLCLAVAQACGDDDPDTANAAAAAIELLHCASLVHDDLPCFDNAAIRRGKPSVHKAFGRRIAVLAGDALIVLAFETVARGAARSPGRLAPLLLTVGQSAGAPAGICAGQAWECEPAASVDLAHYQRSKTGALFSAATMAGAIAAGANGFGWGNLGEFLGEAFQVADDIRDVVCSPEDLGKPVGQDDALDRPSATRQLGLDGAVRHLKRLVEGALESIPLCPGQGPLRDLVRAETRKFMPATLPAGVA